MNTDLVYGFLDESPNLHSASYFFCVSVLTGSNPKDKHLFNIIKNARKRLASKEKQISELKFANTLPNARKLILKAISEQPVEIYAFIVETNKQQVADIPENYGLVVGKTISLVCEIHKNLSMTLDRKYIRPADINKMEKIINDTVMTLNKPEFLTIREGNSQESPLLQLADFIVGAISAKYNHDDPVYWQIIAKRIKKETIVKWKELKRNSQTLRILTTGPM